MTALSRDPSCLKDLAWRMDIPPDAVEAVVDRLVERGHRLVSRSMVIIVDTEEGHRYVFVPRTGRVQLRISYLVPKDDRPDEAKKLFEALTRSLEALPAPP